MKTSPVSIILLILTIFIGRYLYERLSLNVQADNAKQEHDAQILVDWATSKDVRMTPISDEQRMKDIVTMNQHNYNEMMRTNSAFRQAEQQVEYNNQQQTLADHQAATNQ